ncbi:TMV resistance protein N-like [Prunus persica]|uniref:TMV resistance protein N-like n=1 Tax=Prunus persica TaxID=3760 RepID=UPI0009AB26A6|nr:TMV resistance protein N-like [Prunus persica]
MTKMSDLIRRNRAVTTTQSSKPPAQPTSAATAQALMDHLAVGPVGSQAPASSASSVGSLLAPATNYKLEDLDDELLAYVNRLFSERYKQWKSDLHHYFEAFDDPQVALQEGCPKELEGREDSWAWLCAHFQAPAFVSKIFFLRHKHKLNIQMAATRAQQDASPSSHWCTYDAFLSFRATDTRKGFADHLYRALEVAGIHTFRDDDEIERGANILAELQKAIQESRVSIIVFSKDYASSRWCLDERVTIMDRRETNEHMRFNKETDKVEKCRKALRDVADLGGMVLGDRSESQFIQEIVEVIGNKLDHTWNRRLRVDPYVVGIDYRVKGLNMWLEDGSSDVGVAVVYGMGGIGKTTIAKTAYNQNFYKFQGSSFLADIRATSKLPNGLVHFQKNLLSDLQKGKAKKIYSLDEGITKIKQATRCKRVLIALDDVDNLEQFNAILGMREWLHPGSKIIITTRHEHLLKAHENCAMFKVKGLNENESLELFSWHAFRQPHPGAGYMDLSRPVVQHCGGVPLALQVLGSSLFGKAADVWKNALQNLDVITEGKVQKILRISFDSLQDHDKRLFLHIACYFIGKQKDFSTTVLDECGFATNIGIQNLVD